MLGALIPACSSEATVVANPDVIEVSLEELDVMLCNCLHGCGPGLSGSLSFEVENRGERSHVVAFDGFRLTRDDGEGYADLERGHPFNNAEPPSLEPGTTERMSFTVQLDVVAIVEGAHAFELVFLVDGAPVTKSVADQELRFAPTEYCDTD